MVRHCSIALAFLLGGAALTPAAADTLRCGSRLVRSGDSRVILLELCGSPADVENRSIVRRPQYRHHGRILYFGDARVEVPVEVWTYNFGPNKLMRRIKLVDGVVEEIETLGYGYYEK